MENLSKVIIGGFMNGCAYNEKSKEGNETVANALLKK